MICTGSAPHQPADIPFDDIDIDDSDTILMVDRLPKTLVVIGGGVIGCEYASIFAALGVEVTLVEPRDRLLPFLDLEMGERLKGALSGLGVRMRLGQGYKTVERRGDQIVTTLVDGTEIASDKLLFAAGRNGRTRDLGCETVGIQTDKRGYIKVNENYETNASGIYAAGDVIGFPALASTSMEQARVAVCHMFGIEYKQHVSELLPYGIYTIPEVSCVGLGEETARERGHEVVVGRAFFRDNARAKIIGDRDGVIKLVFDRSSRKLLGCHIIGDRASELVHVGQTVIILGGTVDTFIEMVFNYPTLGEAFKYAAYDALGRWNKPPAVE
ncbi:MAG: FAD-dependent oxidoreductase [Polyangiaceae bacterium]